MDHFISCAELDKGRSVVNGDSGQLNYGYIGRKTIFLPNCGYKLKIASSAPSFGCDVAKNKHNANKHSNGKKMDIPLIRAKKRMEKVAENCLRPFNTPN